MWEGCVAPITFFAISPCETGRGVSRCFAAKSMGIHFACPSASSKGMAGQVVNSQIVIRCYQDKKVMSLKETIRIREEPLQIWLSQYRFHPVSLFHLSAPGGGNLSEQKHHCFWPTVNYMKYCNISTRVPRKTLM